MKDMPNLVRKPCAVLLCMVLLLSCAGGALAELDAAAADTTVSQAEDNKLINRYPLYQSDYVEEDIPYYYNYLNEGIEKGYKDAASEVAIDLASGLIEGQTPVTLTDGALDWSEETLDSITWSFTVPEDGFYNIELEYTPLGTGVDNPSRTIEFDGVKPFRELLNVEFSRSWHDANKPWVNSLGDQVRPKQVQDNVKLTARVSDQLGRSNEPLKVYLTAGQHTMTWIYIQEKMSIHSIKLVVPDTYKSYAEVKAEYDAKGYQPVSGSLEGIKIDAEYPSDKSDAALRIMSDSDPKTDPQMTTHTVFNAIGGDTWSSGGQTITWSFDVDTAGLYKIDLRVYCKYNDGLPSYRKILIDDEVPFEELLCYEFEYNRKGWYSTSLKDQEENPYLFYFEPGTHTISMEVVTSTYAEILLELDTTLSLLSDCIQSIIMITGIEPDVNFDYQLDERIPGLMDNFTAISDSLGTQIEILSGGAGKSTSSVSSLRDIKFRIDRMLDDDKRIAKTLTALIEDQTTLSNWINGFNNLPLMLDYLVVSSPEDEFENYNSNFFQRTWSSIRNFLVSFTRDYDVIVGTSSSDADGEDGEGNTEESEPVLLKAWVSRGKEWAEILKQLSDEEFSAQNNIYVDYNMLPAGQLGATGIMLLAVASGTEPDVVIGSDASVPTEYGMRGQVIDLTRFPDYEEVASQLLPGAIPAYTFKDAVYALPETVDFSVMYYRTDTLASLNLQVPDTWEELYSIILPELKRNGMDFWYEGGVNNFLFQQGGSLYIEDGTKSGIGTEAGYEAFKQFCDLYTVYKVPVSANFYNRFRAGQMPIGISSFQLYLQLTSAAPELEGKWAVTVLPATVREDGTKDRSNGVGSTSVMIFGTTEYPEEAWEYISWYLSSETQIRYANDIVAYIGPEARWFSSNMEAFDNLSWDKTLKSAVQAQREFCVSVPNVVGGYITARHQENARVRSVVNKMNYRESLERAVNDINRELDAKNEEFALRAEKEAEQAAAEAEQEGR